MIHIHLIQFFRTTALFFLLVIAGCSDSGDSNGNSSPYVQITFPPYISVVESDQIIVRGTAADKDGVSSVKINGIEATTSNGYLNWEALIPLTDSVNTLVASATDGIGLGAAFANIVYTTKRIQPAYIRAIVSDNINNQLLLLDSGRAELLTYDIATRELSLVSGVNVPDNTNSFLSPGDLALNPTASKAYVTDFNLQAIIEVDLTTGARTVLSDNSTPDSVNPYAFPSSIAFDVTGNRLIVTDAGVGQILGVDLITGARSVIADFSGSPMLLNISGVDIDTVNNRAIYADADNDAIVSVDLTSGARTVLSDSSTPNANTALDFPVDVQIDVNNQIAYVADIAAGYIQVDLTDGTRTALAVPAGTNTAEGILWPNTLALNTANDQLFVTSRNDIFLLDIAAESLALLSTSATPSYSNSFFEAQSLSLTRSERSIVIYDSATAELVYLDTSSGLRYGSSGNPNDPAISLSLHNPLGMMLDNLNNRAILSPAPPSTSGVANLPDDKSIVAISYNDGARTILSNNSTPDTANPFAGIADIARLSDSQLIALDTNAKSLLRVDLSNGERTIISSPIFPNSNNVFQNAIVMTTDLENNIAYVTDGGLNTVLAVDLISGARSVISSSLQSTSDTLFTDTLGMSIDTTGQRLFIADGNLLAIIAVDIASGSRSVLSSRQIPDSTLPFTDLSRLIYGNVCQCLYVLDFNLGLLAVDAKNGQRTVLSR